MISIPSCLQRQAGAGASAGAAADAGHGRFLGQDDASITSSEALAAGRRSGRACVPTLTVGLCICLHAVWVAAVQRVHCASPKRHHRYSYSVTSRTPLLYICEPEHYDSGCIRGLGHLERPKRPEPCPPDSRPQLGPTPCPVGLQARARNNTGLMLGCSGALVRLSTYANNGWLGLGAMAQQTGFDFSCLC